MTTLEFWKQYLKDTNQNEENALYSGELVFEDSGFAGQTQLSLVLSGAKTAVFTPLDEIEINLEQVPVSGEVYVVLDSNDEPRCVIELTDVNVVPFNEIPWDLAQRDGENENLSEWQDKMREYIEDEADLCGFEAREDSKIVCEIFRVIYKK
ncbi:ASCH domain-containing protein [uncultured Treponema sp.]|uniref:ASCH domain-containing protein n=1 Tax=uncultured Treponema sp. TaxID=162155 RepID=UPI0025D42C1A|nr:ASCH domain-containing protein [uncultured Treponema sp.]